MKQYKVTVGIPVYNSENHIKTCLGSILSQSMPQSEIEIIIINDGSTDQSGQILDAYAESHPNIKVIHQENTGGPGLPRNLIIKQARGEFIFFVDADDYLGEEAIERMYRMGSGNRTDIVLGKMIGVNGRVAPSVMFTENQGRTDVFHSPVIQAIGPTKMFRKSFLINSQIAFPVGVCTAEDQPFMVKAYILADGISIVSDYPCYYVVNHDDKQHASTMDVHPEDYYQTLETSIKVIYRYVKDPEKRDYLLAQYLSKELNTGRSILFASSSIDSEEKEHWLNQFNLLLEKWINKRVESLLSTQKCMYLNLAKHHNLERMSNFSADEAIPAAYKTMESQEIQIH
ncbi:glycosyltransferase [Metabacillus sp. GX 13764]|uniref:glycosyltransferase family 2 protein n=1 Tax=Metabacillus kandeliae TaxID=2900151 RepID=UPI001E39C663|nr:glycosyltransferase family 2 protein [Metabacillus kandeliae]MCD7033242.1 glycosyltransferase [Metabacillus kandeliae]